MLSTSPTTAPANPTVRSIRPTVLRTGVAAAAAAAVATTLIAVIAKGVDVPLAIADEPIPVAAFAQLTFICALVGTGLAALIGRRSNRARTLFIRVTIALAVLSIVPDLAADTDAATRLTLIITHVVAALIVIPALADRLTNTH
jgi:Family of unknown function (DUF6069)